MSKIMGTLIKTNPLNKIKGSWLKMISSRFIGRSRTIVLGTFVSQLIAFLTSFVITRYYSPEDIGLLGILSALISIISGTLLFRLDLAIVLAKDEEVLNTFSMSFLISSISSIAFCLCCYFLPFEW